MSPTDEVNNDEPPLPERPLKVIARIYKANNTKMQNMVTKLWPPWLPSKDNFSWSILVYSLEQSHLNKLKDVQNI